MTISLYSKVWSVSVLLLSWNYELIFSANQIILSAKVISAVVL